MKPIPTCIKHLVLIAALALSGCASTSQTASQIANDPVVAAAAQTTLRIAVRRGVADYIERKGQPATAARAARVKALADAILAATGGDNSVTLAALKSLAYAKIPADFSPLDQQDARDVIDLVALAIEQRIGTGELQGDAIVYLRDVLGAVSQAASSYGSS